MFLVRVEWVVKVGRGVVVRVGRGVVVIREVDGRLLSSSSWRMVALWLKIFTCAFSDLMVSSYSCRWSGCTNPSYLLTCNTTPKLTVY